MIQVTRTVVIEQYKETLTREGGWKEAILHATSICYAAAKSLDMEKVSVSQPDFLFQVNDDAMAADKLAEGIRRFAADARALEKMIVDAMHGKKLS